MKRTDQERIERELKRREKRVKVAARREDRPEGERVSPGNYIKDLVGLLQYDEHQVYNCLDDEDVFELLLNMKADLPENKWDGVIRGAIRKTKVQEKDIAFNELKSLLAD